MAVSEPESVAVSVAASEICVGVDVSDGEIGEFEAVFVLDSEAPLLSVPDVERVDVAAADADMVELVDLLFVT